MQLFLDLKETLIYNSRKRTTVNANNIQQQMFIRVFILQLTFALLLQKIRVQSRAECKIAGNISLVLYSNISHTSLANQKLNGYFLITFLFQKQLQ